MSQDGFTRLERFELKYQIKYEWKDAIAEFLHPWCELDKYSAMSPDGFYWITNNYLETPRNTLLKRTLDKIDGRFNMRIRTYGQDPPPDAACHFEVKQKRRDTVVKTRGTIRQGGSERLWNDTAAALAETSGADRANLEHFLRTAVSWNAEPRFLTQYKRRAWFGRFEDYTRVTIDTGMRWREERTFDHGVPDPRVMQPSDLPEFHEPGMDAVMELKCAREQVPWWMLDLIRHLEVRLTGYSKFASASLCCERRPAARVARAFK